VTFVDVCPRSWICALVVWIFGLEFVKKTLEFLVFHWPACKCPKDDRLWNLGAKSEKVYQTWERHQLKQQSKVEAIDQPYQLEVPSEVHQA